MSFRIGVDIGGTFTDFTVVDDAGGVTLWKQDTNPAEPNKAVEAGLESIAQVMGMSVEELLAQTSVLVHGTTIATNTLIQRNGPKVGLLCTEGFRDVLYLRDGFKPDRFNVHMEHPEAFVDRYLRLGVPERFAHDGTEITRLDVAAVRRAAKTFKEAGVESIAVAFLWSIVNPAHEHQAREILGEELPDVPVICSADVLPEIREWERTSATVLSSYILPGISGYLHELETYLTSSGFGRGPLIMQINGGCASVDEILRRPVNVLGSGPAAAPAAATALLNGDEADNVITIDMGGTSLDVCLIRHGRASMSRDVRVEMQPIGVPAVEVRSVGAGGGSIAWIDSGGALRVGPKSAGARPGPVAYGAGGTEPTVTDANVVLGLLSPSAFLGGRRTLDGELARQAVADRIGDALGLDSIEAAAGIIRVINSGMVAAIRGVSVERGIDPRNFVLVAGGGAGGLHAVSLARALGVRSVLIPREAGTLCSFGMTVTDVRIDDTATAYATSDAGDFEVIDPVLFAMEERLKSRLLANGIDKSRIELRRSVDVRYPGQVHELTIPFPEGSGSRVVDCIEGIVNAFHLEHEELFAYARVDMPVEFLHWRVTGIGKSDFSPSNVPISSESPAELLTGVREAYSLVSSRMVPMTIVNAIDLRPGMELAGPAIVESATTTVTLDVDDRLSVRNDGGFLIDVGP
jgi:N-methylhydantoinase A